MSKLIFFNIPATGHMLPAQPVIAEIVRRGNHVIYYNTEDTRAQVEQTGAEFRPYPNNDTLREVMSRTIGGGATIVDNALQLTRAAENLLPFAIEVLRKEKPDAVLHDALAAWGNYAAKVTGIPAVSFVVTFVLNNKSQFEALPTPTPGLVFEMLTSMATRTPAFMQIARRMQRAHGVRPKSLTDALMSLNALNIVFTSREFQPASASFDDSFKFVGPSVTARPDTSGFPFEQLTRKPVIYISLGTINNQNLDFYKACFAAFADYPGQFVLAAGKNTDLSKLEPIPDNFIVRGFVPQLQVLQHSDMFITHAGAGSVNESLWYGVPMVLVPQQIEQGGVAKQVVKHGAGVMARPYGQQPSAGDLRAAVERVLSNLAGHKAAAQRLGDSFRAAGGYVRAADAIMAYTSTGQKR
jgi:MGT family glycosyltransferase